MPSVPLLDSTSSTQRFSVGFDGTNNHARVLLDDTMPRYRASANFTPFATAALTLLNIVGNAVKTVRIMRLVISGVSTALGQSIFQLQRTSTQGTGGTAVNPAIAKLDTSFGAPQNSAAVTHFTTAAQSKGTSNGGPIATWNQFFDTVTTPTVTTRPPQNAFPEGVPGGGIVLRGTTDFLELQNLTPANLGAGTVIAYTIEWVEDNS